MVYNLPPPPTEMDHHGMFYSLTNVSWLIHIVHLIQCLHDLSESDIASIQKRCTKKNVSIALTYHCSVIICIVPS